MNEQELNIVIEHYDNNELAAANEVLADAYFSVRGEYERVMSENKKLRELAQAVRDFLEDINCDGCPCERDCDDNNRMFCGDNISYHAFQTIRELGIEVDK